jgi:hypothetical protein
MNVRELIEELSKLDPDLEVFSAADSEGNYYNRVYYSPTVMVTPIGESRSRIDEVYNDDPDELEDSGYEPDDLMRIVVI